MNACKHQFCRKNDLFSLSTQKKIFTLFGHTEANSEGKDNNNNKSLGKEQIKIKSGENMTA